MKYPYLLSCVAMVLCSCSTYQPLGDKKLYPSARLAPKEAGVTVTYFGNTTILISDGRTNLLVDGFFSRPGALKVAGSKIGPDETIIREQLALGGIKKVDALLVAHTHYDHALDAPWVAAETGAVVMSSKSYTYIHEGAKMAARRDGKKLQLRDPIVVTPGGGERRFGKFVVTYRLSEHVSPHLPTQDKMEGQIIAPVCPPAKSVDYKCGDVFAIHIRHPEGSIAITTSAGAREGQFAGLKADVVMLGVGLMAKEKPPGKREFYWKHTIGELDPQTVIPVHWDLFTKKLDTNRCVKRNLVAPPLKYLDDTRAAMQFVKDHAGGRKVWAMGLRDSFLLRGGKVRLAAGE